MARGGMEDALNRAWGPSFSTGRSVIQGTLEALSLLQCRALSQPGLGPNQSSPVPPRKWAGLRGRMSFANPGERGLQGLEGLA